MKHRVLLFVGLCVALASFALADQKKQDKAQKINKLLEQVKVSLADAVKTAEQKAGGRAVEADLDREQGKLVYEVRVVTGGDKPRVKEVLIDAASGAVLKVEEEDGEEDEKEEEGDGFTRHFPVDKGQLASTGRNTYFILEPGYRLVLQRKKGDRVERLVVSVLDETKVVDGVETRLVEELETVNGKVKERSRNYFAFCKKTSNIYYFGEDAGGAWESGKNGARFGLMMPGTPLLGARHYQEIAPKVALDRAEVKSLTKTFKTPAGTFANCLVVAETTPLEPKELEHKIYAPGIGLVFDAGLKLVEYGFKK